MCCPEQTGADTQDCSCGNDEPASVRMNVDGPTSSFQSSIRANVYDSGGDNVARQTAHISGVDTDGNEREMMDGVRVGNAKHVQIRTDVKRIPATP